MSHVTLRTYDYCQYKGCVKSKLKDKLHRFPTAPSATQISRRYQWITNAGCEKLRSKPLGSLRNFGICGDHFEAKDYVVNPATGEKWLKTSAVPKPYELPAQPNTVEPAIQQLKELVNEVAYAPGEHQQSVAEPIALPGHDASLQDLREQQPMEVDGEEHSQTPGDTFQIPVEGSNVVDHNVLENAENFILQKGPNDAKYHSAKEIFCNIDDQQTDENYLHFEMSQPQCKSSSNNITSNEVQQPENCVSSHQNPDTPQNKEPSGHEFCSETCEQRMLSLNRYIQVLLKEIEGLKDHIHELEFNNIDLKREKKNLREKTYRLQDNLESEKEQQFKDINHLLKGEDYEDFSESRKTLIEMQFKPKNRQKYTLAEQNLCKIMYYHSAAGYVQLRKLGIRLAAESTVRSWVAQLDLRPGLNDIVLEKLEERIQGLPELERLCALKFDELGCKAMQRYNKKFDQIEGLEDMGGAMRCNKVAKHALIFCVDSLNAKNPWRQVLSFGFNHSGASAEQLDTLLKEALTKLQKIGAIVKLIVCDQGTNNQKLFKQYLQVSADKPFFSHNGIKIFAAYDWPHLIKRLIYQLRTHRYIYNTDNEIVMAFSDLVKTYEIDKALESSNVLAFLKDKHFTPNNFDCMKVSLAFQILSRRMAAAMKSAGEANLLGDKDGLVSDTWKQSVEFITMMDTVIDACNSYHLLIVNKQKRPLSDRNPEIVKCLEEFVEKSSKWTTHVVKDNQGKMSVSVVRPPCLTGLPLTATCLLQLWRNIKVEFNAPDFALATGLCNQDSVEHLNSKIRGRNGFNPNPDATAVRQSIQHIVSTDNIQTRQQGNVKIAESHSLLNSNQDASTGESTTSLSAVASNLPELPELTVDEQSEMNNILEAANMMGVFETVTSKGLVDFDKKGFYERNAITYLSGYTARNALKKSKCQACKKVLIKSAEEPVTDNEFYTKCREYAHENNELPEISYLQRPSFYYTHVVNCLLFGFQQQHESLWHYRELVKKNLSEAIEKITNEKFPQWFNKKHPCYEHRKEALKILIMVKIFKVQADKNRKFNTAANVSDNTNQKLKNVMHV